MWSHVIVVFIQFTIIKFCAIFYQPENFVASSWPLSHGPKRWINQSKSSSYWIRCWIWENNHYHFFQNDQQEPKNWSQVRRKISCHQAYQRMSTLLITKVRCHWQWKWRMRTEQPLMKKFKSDGHSEIVLHQRMWESGWSNFWYRVILPGGPIQGVDQEDHKLCQD